MWIYFFSTASRLFTRDKFTWWRLEPLNSKRYVSYWHFPLFLKSPGSTTCPLSGGIHPKEKSTWETWWHQVAFVECFSAPGLCLVTFDLMWSTYDIVRAAGSREGGYSPILQVGTVRPWERLSYSVSDLRGRWAGNAVMDCHQPKTWRSLSLLWPTSRAAAPDSRAMACTVVPTSPGSQFTSLESGAVSSAFCLQTLGGAISLSTV